VSSPLFARQRRAAPLTTGAGTRGLLAHARTVLDAAGLPAPAADAEWLLADLLGCDRLRLQLEDIEVSAAVAEAYRRRLDRRARHEPRQHILGWEEFCGLRLRVSPDVLIPRQETEGLVAWALERLPTDGSAWDVGTGSGGIACALATTRPDCRVVASDRSTRALATAAENVRGLGLAARVHLVAADLFECAGAAVLGADHHGLVDLVVANPPYIPTSVVETLPREVREWEPLEALDGGPDGTAVATRIIADAASVLRPGGWLVMEIGELQSALLKNCFLASGFKEVTVRRDLGGRERYMGARLTDPRSSAGSAGATCIFLGEASEGAVEAPSE
jgi:release factor glutamine methyltransferase